MTHAVVPQFSNDAGVDLIRIGAKEFQCIGARPPFDHPHVYLDMGAGTEILCPYCGTLYRYDPSLAADQSVPSGAAYKPAA